MTIEQADLCERFGVHPVAAHPGDRIGISRSVRDGQIPLNGLRHELEDGTTGWFIWAGEELPSDPDFFVPLHVAHLAEWCPEVLPYLALPPGWRFLLAPGYEDVWPDASLLSM